MNRFLKVVSALVLIVLIPSCKKDDDSVNIVPPRDYAVQYAAEKEQIEEYLKSHYIADVDEDFNINILAIPEDGTQVSIWDQTEYPLQSKEVSLNNVLYTVYYLKLNEGTGEMPTKYDNVLIAYRGFLFDGTQFDYNPFPQQPLALSQTIEGWREIIPLFKAGTLADIPNNPNFPEYEGYGAGVMFLPSDLGYYNQSQASIPAYSPLVFSFRLFDVDYADHDEDGILTKDETIAGVDPMDYDTDGDGDPNFVDIDDDNDSYLTKAELEAGLTCPAPHLDPDCYPGNDTN